MPERLVDVLNNSSTVLHTYVVEVADPAVSDPSVFETKAHTAAIYDGLASDAQTEHLETRLHVSRGGPLAPYGDKRGPLAETKHGLNEVVRELAYSLWEQDGCPQGYSDEYWYRAREQRLRERAYVLWQHEGSPEGRAEEYWLRTCDYEEH